MSLISIFEWEPEGLIARVGNIGDSMFVALIRVRLEDGDGGTNWLEVEFAWVRRGAEYRSILRSGQQTQGVLKHKYLFT